MKWLVYLSMSGALLLSGACHRNFLLRKPLDRTGSGTQKTASEASSDINHGAALVFGDFPLPTSKKGKVLKFKVEKNDPDEEALLSMLGGKELPGLFDGSTMVYLSRCRVQTKNVKAFFRYLRKAERRAKSSRYYLPPGDFGYKSTIYIWRKGKKYRVNQRVGGWQYNNGGQVSRAMNVAHEYDTVTRKLNMIKIEVYDINRRGNIKFTGKIIAYKLIGRRIYVVLMTRGVTKQCQYGGWSYSGGLDKYFNTSYYRH